MGRKKAEPGTRSFELYEEELIQLAAEGLTMQEMTERLKPLRFWVVDKYLTLVKQKWGAKNTPNLIHLWHEKRKNQS